MNRLLIALGGLLAAGCLIFGWTAARRAERETERAARAQAEALRAIIDAEARQSAAQSAAPEPPALESPSLRAVVQPDAALDPRWPELNERLARLESEVRELRERVDGRPKLETYETPESIAQELRGLAGMQGERARRIALLERFLDLFPQHPGADQLLEQLIAERLESTPRLALEALDRYGAGVVADPLELDGLRANVLVQNGRFDEGRACYARIARASPDAQEAAEAGFWIAYSYMQEARYEDAQAGFEDLIARYGSDAAPAMTSLVQGAKNQLTIIAQYKQK